MKFQIIVLVFTIAAVLCFLTACAATAQTTSVPQPTDNAEMPTASAPLTQTSSSPIKPQEPDSGPTREKVPTPSIPSGPIHNPDFAGSAYPKEKEALTTMLDSYLSAAAPMDGAPLVLIVPHAAYSDSGHSLAAAFKQMENQPYDTAVIIGLDQRPPSPAVMSVWEKGGFKTPLGVISVDEAFSQALLAAEPTFSTDTTTFKQEDAIELPLPFLQHVCPACRIVPILVHGEGKDIVEQLSASLIKASQASTGRTVFIAVSNLSSSLKEEDALVVDNATLSAIETRDPQVLIDTIEKFNKKNNPDREQVISGIAPILIAMRIGNALGADQAIVLHYMNTANSPDADPYHVSGYGSAMFWHYDPPALDQTQQTALLDLARKSIVTYLKTGETSKITLDDPLFKRKSGVFVTINKDGVLRGCIGHLWSDSSIEAGVQEMAIAAATSDPRFLRLTPEELAQSKIEISILSPLQKVNKIEDIEIGKHGVYMKYKGRQGVLLPQVAVQQQWNRPKFLDNLCAKSGLPTSCWQENPTLYSFTALVFSEK